MGLRMEGLRQGERRPHQQRVSAEDDAAVRRQLSRPRSDCEGSLGDPVIRITGEFKDNEKKIARSCTKRWSSGTGPPARSTMQTTTRSGTPWDRTTHAYGGTRMGNNPETNVVNGWGFSHEAPNLGILGASVMGTSGARNPTLTLQALAWRTAEYLAKNWKTVAG